MDSIKGAQAPEKFTVRFLESLDFKSTTDRLVIGVLKGLGFLSSDGRPQDRYYRYLDQTQSEIVLAEAIRDAYGDLFQVNTTAQNLSKQEVLGKFRTLSQGNYSDSVLDKMAMTFLELCKLADFKSKPATNRPEPPADNNEDAIGDQVDELASGQIALGGLHYNIQIILPESRDPKVYDALFRSLKEHLR